MGGDYDTPPAEEWEIENVSIQKENNEHFDLPIEFIERFNINDKLINYDYQLQNARTFTECGHIKREDKEKRIKDFYTLFGTLQTKL